MFIQGKTLATALSALAFLSHAVPSYAGILRAAQNVPQARGLKPAAPGGFFGKRADSGISTQQLEAFQNEYTAFHSGVNSWLATASQGNDAAALAQLKQELSAYDGFVNDFLGSALKASAGPSAPPYPTGGAGGPGAGPTGTGAPIPAGGYPSGTGAPYPYSSATGAPIPYSPARTGILPSGPGPVQPSGSPKGGSGKFNARANDNVAVYYGQSAATTKVPLSQLCADKDNDIIILAFLNKFSGAGGYPGLNLGSACSSPSAAQTAKGAKDLLGCPDLAKEIKTCQAAGKKVMLSLGGESGNSAFSSDAEATKLATQLWDLFGGGKGEEALRPFGDVVIDGFDIDNENKKPEHYTTFVSALRTAYKADTSKPYYISAAPQCPRPDASIPLAAMQTMDFVFVQFYNNGNCNVGQSGFVDSFKNWSTDLAAKGNGPMLYIGAPGCAGSACAGSGYNKPALIKTVIQSVSKTKNMGGVMLWDGAEAKTNMDAGSADYISVVKSALA